MRRSKELAKRLRYTAYPRPDGYQRSFALSTLAALVVGVAGWALGGWWYGERLYEPAPVTSSHAVFGEDCGRCHEPYQRVADDGCRKCHVPEAHSPLVETEDPCRNCHVEHQGEGNLLRVDQRACVACHGALDEHRPETRLLERITSFADHPEFPPLRPGGTDRARIRFNHEAHLQDWVVDSLMPRLLRRPLELPEEGDPWSEQVCMACHLPSEEGGWMAPIEFETHCQGSGCHELSLGLAQTTVVEVPHEDTAAIRERLIREIYVLAAEQPGIFSASVRRARLPGRPAAPQTAAQKARDLGQYKEGELAAAEAALYRAPSESAANDDSTPWDTPRLGACFLCHQQGRDSSAARGNGDDRPLVPVARPRIPERWLRGARFDHERHTKLPCAHCHADVRTSRDTADVNLPRKRVCESCHHGTDASSAGDDCVLCHQYHDAVRATPDPLRVPPIPMDWWIPVAAQSAAGGTRLPRLP